MGTAVELAVLLSGRALKASDLIEAVRTEYEQFSEGYVLPAEFWGILLDIFDEGVRYQVNPSLRIFLNNFNRLSLCVDDVPIRAMRGLLDLVRVIVMSFVGPGGAPESSGDHQILTLLSRPSKPRQVVDSKIKLSLGPTTPNLFGELCHRYLAGLAGSKRRTAELSFTSNSLDVEAEACRLRSNSGPARDFAHAVEDISRRQIADFRQSTRGFDQGIAPVPLTADEWLQEFFNQDVRRAGLLVGSSGSGKTTALRSLIGSDAFLEHHLVLISVAAQSREQHIRYWPIPAAGAGGRASVMCSSPRYIRYFREARKVGGTCSRRPQ